MLMRVCPFCGTDLDLSETFCNVCGNSFLLALPYPVLIHRKLYFALSTLSILSGIVSCAFTFVAALYMVSLFFVIGAIGLAGITLERAWGKSQTLAIKVLAAIGLFFGVLGYVCFMFIHSNVPVCGYTM
jgi:hypothetical protein